VAVAAAVVVVTVVEATVAEVPPQAERTSATSTPDAALRITLGTVRAATSRLCDNPSMDVSDAAEATAAVAEAEGLLLVPTSACRR
jgi:hypothetical protein